MEKIVDLVGMHRRKASEVQNLNTIKMNFIFYSYESSNQN